MSTVDSDFDVRLSGELSAAGRQRWLKPASAPAERSRDATHDLPAPPPPPAANEATTEPEPIDLPRWRWQAVPSWLVSTVVHLLMLIALGLLTLPPRLQTEENVVEVAYVTPAALQTIDDVILTPPLEEVQHVAVEAPAGALDDLANLTDAATLGAADGASVQDDVDAIHVGELSDVFGSSGSGLKSIGGGSGSAEFFGVKAGGRRFVFVVDSSNSMRGQKFADAKEELMYAVRRLDKTQAFYVIFFDVDALRMFADEDSEAEARPVPATIANIRKLETWMKSVENERRTDPYDAVKVALEMRPDAIFILSDGQFTDRGRTVDYLARENVLDDPVDGRRPRVVVHTIGFYSKDGEVTLSAIAKAYGGTYRFVAPPNGLKKKDKK